MVKMMLKYLFFINYVPWDWYIFIFVKWLIYQQYQCYLFKYMLIIYLYRSQQDNFIWDNFQSNFNFYINSLCSECLRCKLSSLYMFTLVVTKLILFYQKVANYLKALDQSWAVLKVFVTMTMNNFIILQHTELLLLV